MNQGEFKVFFSSTKGSLFFTFFQISSSLNLTNTSLFFFCVVLGIEPAFPPPPKHMLARELNYTPILINLSFEDHCKGRMEEDRYLLG